LDDIHVFSRSLEEHGRKLFAKNSWPLKEQVANLQDCPSQDSLSSTVSSTCWTYTCDFCPTPLLPGHHFMTFSQDPEARTLIPPPGSQISIRRICHDHSIYAPRPIRATCSRRGRLHFRHWFCDAAIYQ
jgi:hypothetical protein